MELRDALRTTGAVREFDGSPVDRATVYDLLETARFAPSGGNRQGWRVVLVEDRARRRALRDLYLTGWYEYLAIAKAGLVPFAPITDRVAEDAARKDAPAVAAAAREAAPGFAERLDEVPVLLVLLADLRALAAIDRDEEGYSFVGGASLYPFAWSILLAAHDAGLGGVLTTMARRRQADVLELLNVTDANLAVAGVLALGRPTTRATRLRRQAVEEFATIDAVDGPAAHPLSASRSDCEVLGQRRGGPNRRVRVGVREAEDVGVQEDAALGERGLAVLPVAGVVHDRPADGGEVHADLVGPSGLEPQLEQRARRARRSGCAPRTPCARVARPRARPSSWGCAGSARSARRSRRARR